MKADMIADKDATQVIPSSMNQSKSNSNQKDEFVVLNDGRGRLRNLFGKNRATKVVLVDNRVPFMALYQVRMYCACDWKKCMYTCQGFI